VAAVLSFAMPERMSLQGSITGTAISF